MESTTFLSFKGFWSYLVTNFSYMKCEIKLMKGKTPRKHSLHGGKSSVGIIEVVHQWL